MKGIFDPDNPVVRGIAKFGYIWYLNLLWLVTSLPIFTIGASTTALIYSCSKLHDNSGYPTKNFFSAFKSNFKQSTAIWGIYGGTGALILLDFVVWHRIDKSSITTGIMIAIALFWVATILWVFAIQSKFVNTVKDTLHYTVLIACRHFKETILMVVTVGAVGYLNVMYSAAVNFVTLAFGIGAIAYLFTVFYANTLDTYIKHSSESDEDEEDYDPKEADMAMDALVESLKKQ